MEFAVLLLGIVAANTVGILSPGPAVVLVAQRSIGASRGHGLLTAAGIATGSTVWAVAAVFGISVLMAQYDWLYAVLRVGGGLYLLYLAVMLWRGADKTLPTLAAGPGGRLGALAEFRKGLLLQLVNPKAGVFYGSVLLALLPADAPGWLLGMALGLIVANEFFWYLSMAWLFSVGAARRVYMGAKAWVDRVAAGLMGALGVKLAAHA